MMNIVYRLGEKIYLNITNRCPCACEFCVRRTTGDMGTGNSLWLDREPTIEEIKSAIDGAGIPEGSEVVFCGFGEPTERLEVLRETAAYLKEKIPDVRLRINTNGLSDLINGREHTALELEGLIDKLSISLNAPTAEEYVKIVHPKFGKQSFEAMLAYAQEAATVVPEVILSVVDVIGEDAVEQCRKLCAERGLKLRVRKYSPSGH